MLHCSCNPPNCQSVGTDIQTCQQNGKRVFISMGGASGPYGLSSDSMATQVAADMWNLFLGGSSSSRPFGSAVLDGVDMDFEGTYSSAPYYGALVSALKAKFASDASRTYYISYATI